MHSSVFHDSDPAGLAPDFHYLEDPAPGKLGETPEAFLATLPGPTLIYLHGEDRSRTRALVTLLHGNEPSGFRALHRWLRSGARPRVNIVCLIASVEAAQRPPTFSHRTLPGQRDLNRCFRAPFEVDAQGLLAQRILAALAQYAPEAVIDVHNTSGSGPSFAVSISADARHLALCTLFTRRMVLTDLRMGSLMEIGEHMVPTITIECGGRLDDGAHTLAWAGIDHFFRRAEVLHDERTEIAVEVMRNPVRLELTPRCTLAYAEAPRDDVYLTLRPGIERHNFGVTPAGTALGWVRGAALGELFVARNNARSCLLRDLLLLDHGALLTRQALKLFMITNNPDIARSDCLLYAVQADGSELVPGVGAPDGADV
ncbi:MAG: succinylglutamate desuccinylase/aspartoacylase family protein [Rhodocyclaceae bacterium]|nr:succinylglutamate desuccinylase/aspartoacylase family protein [Rhodocyclaceae bacterium]MCP5232255.1 succinylglutamate desuccinylase/aspartoacylase family protein [Zoogloeaceae bacterium]MCB1910361.1 succinylglutamate desuccinylase/aspartoacylase family protein [Rhodocyclaceae bacterium]MCP5241537.1 succinylglutamate desuccinylase/aspartoacylase family protein [Zoogloeaceae bacterium]MCP5256082.1 succinylglutamate desuccinylase/aspartoacylase family protein [Zoogloeaceae bacterium]